MATAIKDYYDLALAARLAEEIRAVDKNFDEKAFSGIIKKGIRGTELKERLNLYAEALYAGFNEDYPGSLKSLQRFLPRPLLSTEGMFNEGYHLYPVSQYIENYGLSHFDASVAFIYELTQRFTGEFCIRPFLQKEPVKIQKLMLKYTRDKNVHVRRFASEGIRPMLPWAKKFMGFAENPAPAFEVLSRLRKDPEKYVQKSVANHIRDYIKLNPAVTLPLLKEWLDEDHPATNWIARHALRPKISAPGGKLQKELASLIAKVR